MTTRLIVDLDMGVDDAVAVAWLLLQTQYPVEIVGITTVAGNSTLENVTKNTLTLLKLAGATDIPVVRGAAAPLQMTLSATGGSVHGPDGLWFASAGYADLPETASANVSDFYRDAAAPDVVLVMLGPLTNLARALEEYPEAVSRFGEIIVLGGARHGGNRTPVAEFNIWADPEAAGRVLQSGLPLTMVPLDTFYQFVITRDDLSIFSQSESPLGPFLYEPLLRYSHAQRIVDEPAHIRLPDLVGVMLALDHGLGSSQPALVKVVQGIDETNEMRLFRGQTVVGLTPSERLPMIASDHELNDLARKMLTDPSLNLPEKMGAILAREPANVKLMVEIDAEGMYDLLVRAFETAL